jgi:hypothetical protein
MLFPGCDLQTMSFHFFKGSWHIFLVSKIVVGESHYLVGKKYCRRCECYLLYHQESLLSMLWNAAQDYPGRKRIQRRNEQENKRKLGIVLKFPQLHS